MIAFFGKEDCTVISYRFGYRGQINTVSLRDGNIQNSHRAGQDGFSAVIKCNSEQDHQHKMAFIRMHQASATSMGSFDPTIRFLLPSKNIDFSGFIKNVSHEVERFTYAPTISINMELARDNINSIGYGTTGTPSWDSVIYGAGQSAVANPDDWVLPDPWDPPKGHPALDG